MNNTQKKSYHAPQLTKVGSFETVTQQNKTGNYIDMTFTGGTLVGSLTLS